MMQSVALGSEVRSIPKWLNLSYLAQTALFEPVTGEASEMVQAAAHSSRVRPVLPACQCPGPLLAIVL